MKLGTKTVLFGYHQFLLHPLVVAVAWWKLYGFPWDPRLWFAFFLHDIGYAGKSTIDGPDGKSHPFFGALVMHYLFDNPEDTVWMDLCLCHSRCIARTYFKPYSRLCHVDKLAFTLYPDKLLKFLFWLSGEGTEYLNPTHADTVQAELGVRITDINEFIHQGKISNFKYLSKECPEWKP